MKGVSGMELYLVDVQRKTDTMDDQDMLKADDIILNRNLIRGYSLNYYTALNYVNFMNSIIGKYVDIIPSVCNVPDDYTPEDCEILIMNKYNNVFTQIQTHMLSNGGDVGYSESMIDYSTSVWRYEGIWEYILFLFDDILKYVPSICENDDITNTRQFIFDGMLSKICDVFDDQSNTYTFDPYAILKLYITKLLFI